MDVNIPQPFSHKPVIFNELPHLIIICPDCQRNILKKSEYFCSIFKISASEFTNYEWVTGYMTII